jgi:hypothetical protein
MRALLAALCVVLALPAWARGGAQQFQYDSGYSFRDVVGQTYANHYGWNAAQIVDPSRAVYMGSDTPSRFPNSTVAWTIEAGDHGAGGTLERNEFADMFGTSQQDESPASGTKYYALSVYIPSGWVDPGGDTRWFVVSQLHPSDSNTGHSAVADFALLLASDLAPADHYALRTLGGPIGDDGTVPSADDVVTDLGPHVYDKWVDFVFKVTWASDVEGGAYRVSQLPSRRWRTTPRPRSIPPAARRRPRFTGSTASTAATTARRAPSPFTPGRSCGRIRSVMPPRRRLGNGPDLNTPSRGYAHPRAFAGLNPYREI